MNGRCVEKISIQSVSNSNPSQGHTDNISKASQVIIDIEKSLNDDEYVWYVHIAGAALSELYAIDSWIMQQHLIPDDIWFIESKCNI